MTLFLVRGRSEKPAGCGRVGPRAETAPRARRREPPPGAAPRRARRPPCRTAQELGPVEPLEVEVHLEPAVVAVAGIRSPGALVAVDAGEVGREPGRKRGLPAWRAGRPRVLPPRALLPEHEGPAIVPRTGARKCPRDPAGVDLAKAQREPAAVAQASRQRGVEGRLGGKRDREAPVDRREGAGLGGMGATAPRRRGSSAGTTGRRCDAPRTTSASVGCAPPADTSRRAER